MPEHARSTCSRCSSKGLLKIFKSSILAMIFFQLSAGHNELNHPLINGLGVAHSENHLAKLYEAAGSVEGRLLPVYLVDLHLQEALTHLYRAEPGAASQTLEGLLQMRQRVCNAHCESFTVKLFSDRQSTQTRMSLFFFAIIRLLAQGLDDGSITPCCYICCSFCSTASFS